MSWEVTVIDLFGVASSCLGDINPMLPASIKVSNGYDIVNYIQVPKFTVTTGFADLQALDGDELKQIDNINQQGTIRGAYLYGALAGVVRPDGKGGDILSVNGKDWLVFKVLETWSDWVKVAVVYQGESA
jgi:hypothetical protein